MTNRTPQHAATRAALALGLVLTLSAATYSCGATGPSAEGAHDAQDVAFTQHLWTIESQVAGLAGQVASSTANGPINALATEIRNADSVDAGVAQRWLQGWGVTPRPVATETGIDGNAFLHGVVSLESSTSFLGEEERHGKYPPAKALAADTILSFENQVKAAQNLAQNPSG